MKLYKCTSDPNALVPDYTNEYPTVGEIPTTPYEPLDDLNGYVILDYNESYNDYNKAELYGKYYTITSRVKDIGHKMRLNLEVDVMKTYADEIKDCFAVIERTSADQVNLGEKKIGWNSYLPDPKNVRQVNNQEIECEFEGTNKFTYDSRPYLLAIGCDAPDLSLQTLLPNMPGYAQYASSQHQHNP